MGKNQPEKEFPKTKPAPDVPFVPPIVIPNPDKGQPYQPSPEVIPPPQPEIRPEKTKENQID